MTFIADLGSCYSFRVTPAHRNQRISLQELRRTDRLTMKLAELATKAHHHGDTFAANGFRHHMTRIRKGACLPVFHDA